jgi:cytochrome c-type biogenesis protein CcmH/NrfG
LGRVLLDAKDWAAAQQALRDILRLDPHNREALENLWRKEIRRHSQAVVDSE